MRQNCRISVCKLKVEYIDLCITTRTIEKKNPTGSNI